MSHQGFTPAVAEVIPPRRRPTPKSPRTLVTGGAGFVGSYVCRALADSGREVCAFDIRPFTPEGQFVLGQQRKRVLLEQGSIDDVARFLDIVATFEPSEIVHMAMILDPGVLARNRTTGFRVNVGGTITVLEAMRLFGVERLVNFSSIGVLPPKLYEPIDSQHPFVTARSGPGSDFYGAAKGASELFCFAYQQAMGINFRTIRPSAVYGLGMTHFPGPIKSMVEGAVRGEKVRFETGGKHPRDYTHATDIASLVLALLSAPDTSDRIFYGATGEPLVSTTEVARIVMEVVPGSDIKIGARLADAEKSVVALRGQLSIRNARRQLGWKPRFGNLRDGIADYASSYRSFLESGAG
jgi:nucleoside-diphosphate-sugar epimerase